MITLYRPVGLYEMELILEMKSSGFPLRLPGQPIFYPVLNREYAEEIAHKWNTVDTSSGYAGFVTGFDVDESYIKCFERKVVGHSKHEELWIPAEQLNEFNQNINGYVRILQGFFGTAYVGLLPDESSLLAGKNVKDQFLVLQNLFESKSEAFYREVIGRWRLILLNFFYWFGREYDYRDISGDQKYLLLKAIKVILKEQGKWSIICNIER